MASSPAVDASGYSPSLTTKCGCLAAIPDTSISGHHVARELTGLIGRRASPGRDRVQLYGTKFTSNAVLAYSEVHRVEWHDIALGKPLQKGSV
jgi:hypothetical protein